jgi:molecular chaperone HtpG
MQKKSHGRFQVDLRGIISLLSRNLYSTSGVYLRELLQNAHDALIARREIEPEFTGGIRIIPIGVAAPGSPVTEFTIIDDGVGLTLAEVESVLSTVGASSKRDIWELPREGFLGRFGIGLLSCFLVSDEIRLVSRSARGGRPVEWRGSGDGTYVAHEVDVDVPVGTTVRLTPRGGDSLLLEVESVEQLVRHYAEFLPSPVAIATAGADRYPTGDTPFLLDPTQRRDDVLAYGERLLGRRPFDAIPLDIPATQTRGVAYVLPVAAAVGSVGASRVYAGGMLVSERQERLTPDWAFFVRVVADSVGLHPTASREAFVDDDALDETRREIGNALRAWIMELGSRDPWLMAAFIETHAVSLKLMALEDDEFARFILRWLPFETSRGTMRVSDILRVDPAVSYAQTVDEFRQVAALSTGDKPLVNGGFTFDADIIQRLPAVFDGVTVTKLDVGAVLDELTPPPLDDRASTVDLELRVARALAELECDVVIRSFPQADPSAVLVVSPAYRRRMDRRRTRSRGASATWNTIFDRVDDLAATAGDAEPRARLCLNWQNRVVRGLGSADEATVFPLLCRVLYVQALMSGFHPLTARDRATLSDSLADLLALTVGGDPKADI